MFEKKDVRERGTNKETIEKRENKDQRNMSIFEQPFADRMRQLTIDGLDLEISV